MATVIGALQLLKACLDSELLQCGLQSLTRLRQSGTAVGNDLKRYLLSVLFQNSVTIRIHITALFQKRLCLIHIKLRYGGYIGCLRNSCGRREAGFCRCSRAIYQYLRIAWLVDCHADRFTEIRIPGKCMLQIEIYLVNSSGCRL